MNVYTIGFTQKKAERFFSLLRAANINTLIDVRLNNVSQLAGFAKRDDLRFFLKELCQAEYVHMPELAPTQDILKAYKQGEMTWAEYEKRFLDLMTQRQVERVLDRKLFDGGCLLCSEHKPHQCHRRLVVEYLNDRWETGLKVEHLY
ncbi:hypothetical protein CFI10_04215 [Marinobacterium iners]|uniref:DUF488 domain-containing protein n=1 Tax=Marinobacterium iners TaxID=48076 RepID=UPI001A9052B5|nr:DUF488 domain-containing protein [Marinobacterium iners]QSR34198.1 hypothetical protein CFI10_04215 [Marinobacterium iners]